MLHLSSIIHNPVLLAELHYQRFAIQRSRSGIVWIILAVLLLLPSLLASLAFVALCLILPLLPDSQSIRTMLFPFMQEVAMVLVIIINGALYPTVTLVSLGLSANSVLRERNGRTWDNLLLTDIGAWNIVIGKWLASVRSILGDHFMVIVARMGLVGAMLFLIAPFFATLASGYRTFDHHIVPMLIITLIYGVLDASLTAALGTMAGIPQESQGTILSTLAFSTRVIVMIGSAIWFIETFSRLVNVGVISAYVWAMLGMPIYIVLIALSLLMARYLIYE